MTLPTRRHDHATTTPHALTAPYFTTAETRRQRVARGAYVAAAANGFAWMVTERTTIGVTGLHFFPSTGAFSMASSVSKPSMRCPKTVYCPSRCLALA